MKKVQYRGVTTIDHGWIRGVAPLDASTAVQCVHAPARRPRSSLTIAPFNDDWSDALRRFNQRRRVEKVFAWDVLNCALLPPFMFLVTEEGWIVRQTVRKSNYLKSLSPFSTWSNERLTQFMSGQISEDVASAASDDIATVEEPCILLGSGPEYNYFHWLMEFLPKLDLVRDEMAAGRRLVVPGLESPFHAASLRYFGIDPDACIALARPTRFRELRFFSNIVTSSTRLSSFVDGFFTRHQGSGSNRLYVSRADANVRRVLNERDLDFLAEFGFERLVGSSLSFADQAEKFKNAEIVIGPHGAGLANTAFMRSGGHVIELLPDSFGRKITCYAALSDERGLTHTILLSPSRETGANADFHVMPDDLTALLQLRLTARPSRPTF